MEAVNSVYKEVKKMFQTGGSHRMSLPLTTIIIMKFGL